MFKAILLSVILLCYAGAQTSLDQVLDSIGLTHHIGGVALSPGGKRVAWTDDGIYWRDVATGAKPRRLTACKAECGENGLAWSPDESRAAFLSDAEEKGQSQLYVASLGNEKKLKAPKRLTELKGFLQDLKWSPDGRSVALLFTENAPRSLGPVEAIVPELGVIEDKVFDQRLAIVDAASGAVRQITPANIYVFEYDWAPDSKRLVYTAAPPPGDDNWYLAHLYTIDAAACTVARLLQPEMQMAMPRWSPDGNTIAFIGGLMSDEGVTGGDIYTIAATGGAAKNITPGRRSSPSSIAWTPSSHGFIVEDHVNGLTQIATLDLSGAGSVLWSGEESIEFSGDATTSAAIRSSWSLAPEVWAGPTGHWEQITHVNDPLKPLWGEAKSITWTSDNFDVQGWLVFPAHYDAKRRYPMVVVPHGGPAAERRPAWPGLFFDLTALSSQGYFVFYPNPRGSYGQGEAFTRANVKDFGYGDLRDILSGVDKVAAEYPIDSRRIGLAGWSYGGYMTMWTLTQTARFRAAVSGAGLSNWQSYYGENSIDQWLIPYFGASVYDDPEIYAKSSPINFIKHVKTPTLIVVGELDGEVPSPQSREYWHALKALDVKTQLVIYAGEGHRFHDAGHIRDLMFRTVEWFNREMPEGESR